MRSLSTSDLIRRAGEALYGVRWQAPLAAELRISDATLRLWLSGRMQLRPEELVALSHLVEQRQAQLGEVAEMVVVAMDTVT